MGCDSAQAASGSAGAATHFDALDRSTHRAPQRRGRRLQHAVVPKCASGASGGRAVQILHALVARRAGWSR
jgi:hypothetical protein